MKKKKLIVKIVVIIILVALGVLLGNFAYGKFVKNKFKKILQNNDASNYELIEYSNDEENSVWVRDKILFSKNGNTEVWISELDAKRIVMDTSRKTAMITENSSDFDIKVNTLNYTYINDFFENSNQKFKYKGKSDGYYLLEFTNSKTGIVSTLYLNTETNIVDKVIEVADEITYEIDYEVKVNSVSKEEVEIPDLTDYLVQDSVSSGSVK
jgi:hypothetical protein